ncbi:MAG: hypothetical protein QW506_07705, partial [Thermoproteota archaeon]
LKKENAPEKLKETALKVCEIIGDGLYGVDIKERNGEFIVVEVNDNPSIYAGHEDLRNKDLYSKIISFLTN